MPNEYMPRVFVSVGSNISPDVNLKRAVSLLSHQCEIKQLSSVYRAPAFGFENQPDFLDVMVEIATSLQPEHFKTVLNTIEKQLGRDRASQGSKYGPLTLDMDILLWGDNVLSYGKKPWRVPDESILKYAAIAIPLAEIAPEFIHPAEHVTLRSIAERFNRQSIQKTDLSLEW